MLGLAWLKAVITKALYSPWLLDVGNGDLLPAKSLDSDRDRDRERGLFYSESVISICRCWTVDSGESEISQS